MKGAYNGCYRDRRLDRLLRNCSAEDILFQQPDDEILMSRQRLARYEKAVQNTSPESEPSQDEILLVMGYLPSSDKRSCCREKQR